MMGGGTAAFPPVPTIKTLGHQTFLLGPPSSERSHSNAEYRCAYVYYLHVKNVHDYSLAGRAGRATSSPSLHSKKSFAPERGGGELLSLLSWAFLLFLSGRSVPSLDNGFNSLSRGAVRVVEALMLSAARLDPFHSWSTRHSLVPRFPCPTLPSRTMPVG